MWRYAAALVVIAVSLVAARGVERLAGDEDLAWLVAMAVDLIGIPALWPVHFGLRDPRPPDPPTARR